MMLKSLLRVTGSVVVGSALLLAGFGLMADGKGGDVAIEIDVPKNTPSEVANVAVTQLERFKDACPALFTAHKDRIISKQAALWDAMPYRQETYGWDRELRLQVVVAEDGAIASGHTVEYYIWDDAWLVQKPQGAALCGEPGNSERDTYVEFSAS